MKDNLNYVYTPGQPRSRLSHGCLSQGSRLADTAAERLACPRPELGADRLGFLAVHPLPALQFPVQSC